MVYVYYIRKQLLREQTTKDSNSMTIDNRPKCQLSIDPGPGPMSVQLG